MDYKEINELAGKITPEEFMQLFNSFINKGGDTRLTLAIEGKRNPPILQQWHPTLQQCLMRGFIMPSISAFAGIMNPDERNENTVRCCREMLPILKKFKFPFV